MAEVSSERITQPASAVSGPVSHAIFRVARIHRMLAGSLLRDVGLYPGQELVMMHLWETGAQRQTELAKVLDSDAATMTRTVQRLEKAGFVRRGPDPTDKRACLIEPTVASQVLRRQVEDVWNRLEQLTVADAPADRQRELLDQLLAVENNLLAAVEKLRPKD
ncbi:MarR family winged helix-turn-helix transcriptional regulator [Streptomyces sp. DSM 3412]|uniref:MarR family winged helix-turn-helix transcriptional regulator n=1 Tax=Streptomyces gottesmaniae TaxID=3075518 RepID=A0ABU2YTI7_9ACTN|nr:MarR family winged helix-turn-helix transcriptional regulator [Streptomyces sp. DSM 3412]MDT0567198.1 MarR family winged helix-turn-helix transcriptional regulator [Streptomyces sp. DSM 3412]